ncbi:MAG: SpoIID/LytB domain-containing protein [Clostridiales bacterium]|nr:SpoIID/LytB domain-containing protein [Clostridiales bacterium]
MGSKKKQKQNKLRRRRIVVFVSCVLVILLAFAVTLPILKGSSDISARSSDIVDDGIIRVYLRSLGSPKALGLTLDGVYTVDGDAGFRFARGTEVTVAEDSGTLYLSAGGLTIDMGGAFTLKRHAPEDNSDPGGIYIHESEKDNLFKGDLRLSSDGRGISSVLSIQVEDYLCGVVAYEMSNSFPLEALKAQAVAARTYALRAKQNAGKSAYDLVDTTQDQVYKGFDSSLTTVIRAVEQTRGVVGMAGGKYAQCYYTASNGGQIASTKQIWGGTVSYIQMKDDPYDIENPYSQQKTVSIPKQLTDSNPLYPLIMDALKLKLPSAKEIRLDSVASLKLTDPDTEGSLMYKTLEVYVNVSTREMEKLTPSPEPEVSQSPSPSDSPSPTAAAEKWVLGEFKPLEAPVKVTFGTYSQLKELLKLKINSSNYEVFAVEEDEDAFTLISRRFGHGVGMSQRGAQTMAGKHHKEAEEILSFYYPGLEWYKIDWKQSSLVPLSALPDSLGYARAKPTPRPTQAPLPPLEDGEYYATVTATTLNVRTAPTTQSQIAALLYSGEKVIVTGQFEDNWVSFRTVELTGYVKADYLKKD